MILLSKEVISDMTLIQHSKKDNGPGVQASEGERAHGLKCNDGGKVMAIQWSGLPIPFKEHAFH